MKNENIKTKPVEIQNAIFSLQLHFIMLLPWSVRGKLGEGEYQLQSSSEAQASTY